MRWNVQGRDNVLGQHPPQGLEQCYRFGALNRLHHASQKFIHLGRAQGLRVVALQFSGDLIQCFHAGQKGSTWD